MRDEFSIRVLLINATITGVLVCRSEAATYQSNDQDKKHNAAVDRLETTGGIRLALTPKDVNAADHLKPTSDQKDRKDDYPFGPVEIVSIHDVQPDDRVKRALKDILDLRGARLVYLRIERLDVAALELLRQVKDLRQLRVSCDVIDDEAASRLNELSAIESLTVKAPISDRGIAAVAKLVLIESLDCDFSTLTSEGAKSLKSLKRAAKSPLEIHLRNKPPSAEVIESISNHNGEVHLHFHEMDLADTEISKLKSGMAIVNLDFDNCRLSAELWPAVSSMRALKKLKIQKGGAPSPPDSSIDLRLCKSLKTVVLSPIMSPTIEIRTFQPPPDLEYLHVCGKLELATLRQILSAAPNCEVRCDVPDEHIEKRRTGEAYRVFEGKVQSYKYDQENWFGGLWIDYYHRGNGVPPPWKDVKEAVAY